VGYPMHMRLLFFALCIFVAFPSAAQETKPSTPEAVVQAFADAMNKRDLDAAAKLVSGGVVDPATRASYLKEPMPQFMVSDLKSRIVDDYALVTFRMKTPETEEIADYIVLVRSGSNWLIEPPMKGNGLPLSALMLSSVPMMTSARLAAKSAVCLSNLKQMAVAVMMFEGDADDVLKVTATNWLDKISPYLRSRDILKCPEDTEGPVSYSLNAKLIGKSAVAIEDPANTVLLYEGKGGQLVFRHQGRAAVAYADGHAKLVNEADAKKLRWNP
jgi:prepilin-type processing-associated H-X9-DG protein